MTSATMSSGTQIRKRTCTAKSQRNGNSTWPLNANPCKNERMNRGSQVNRASNVARLAGRANSGLTKPERARSLKNGPPLVSEKSSRFRESVVSIKVHVLIAFAVRSEERRVGKEC